MPLWAVFFLTDVIGSVTELYSVTAAIPFHVFLTRVKLTGHVIYIISAISFLLCIGAKYRMASSQDVKRRIRVLFAGTALALLPLTGFFAVEQVRGVTEAFFPHWFRIIIFLSVLLLPITFAYVIVVQRALDVRVVLRQGLQYTLASRGIIVLQLLLSVALFLLAWGLVTSRSVSAPVIVATVAAGVAGLLLLQSGRRRLALWIDRRFFRDAYDAEQILSELSEQVRTMVEIKPLLEVVASRIASSLHVKELAVLLRENGIYRPCYAVGFDCLPEVLLPADAATVQLLRSEKQLTRVYVDDPDSWLNRPGIQREEQEQVALLKPELLLPLCQRRTAWLYER